METRSFSVEEWKVISYQLSVKEGWPPWTDPVNDMYAAHLAKWPHWLAIDVTTVADGTLSKRPSLADLNKIAIEILRGPLPTADEVFMEVVDVIRTHGAYAVQDPENSRVKRQGPPGSFSDPIVDEVVSRMGGYLHIISAWPHDGKEGVLRSQFRKAYEDVVSDHERRVIIHFTLNNELPPWEYRRTLENRYQPLMSDSKVLPMPHKVIGSLKAIEAVPVPEEVSRRIHKALDSSSLPNIIRKEPTDAGKD